jgi:radical SAM superfamily enzyme YgiQ (UPF0313 family)
MRILLITPTNSDLLHAVSVPVGLVSIGTYLKQAGHEVKIADLSVSHISVSKLVREFRPDLCGVSVRSAKSVSFAVDVSKKVHRLGVPVVWGGPFCDQAPLEHFFDSGIIDVLSFSEGEMTWLELADAFENGKDLEARRNMLRASYLAGTAFTKSYVGYVHAVAHTLGGKYGIAHGLANAVLLPHVLRAYGSSVTKPLADISRIVGLSNPNISDAESAELFISHIEGMNQRMQIPTILKEIKKEDIPYMALLADKEANPLYPVPTVWDAKELENLYLLVCEK